MSPRTRRTVYLCVRFGALAIAVAWVVFAAPPALRSLERSDYAALLFSLALLIVLLRISVPSLSSLVARKHRRLQPGQMTLDLPLIALLLVAYGGPIAAAIALIAYPLAIPAEGRSRLLRRTIDGGLEALFILFMGQLLGAGHRPFYTRTETPSIAILAAFVTFFTLGHVGFSFFIWQPIRSLRNNVWVLRLWRQLLGDTRRWTATIAMSTWAYVCSEVFLHDGRALGLSLLVPLPFFAATLRRLHEQRIEVQRLRLARGAVHALLGARNPLPQINALLGSIYTQGSNETLQIFASIAPDDNRLAPLASIGPAPGPEATELVRITLLDLQRRRQAQATMRTRDHVVFAHAVRDGADHMLGALVVHRPPRTAQLVPSRALEYAAVELAPLLRDFRSIADTQNAASIDGLTGLANRRAWLAALRERVEQVTVGNPCAVVLIDVDHFKNINDDLGHQRGDECLRMVGATIARSIRSVDMGGRIGGEEFVVLMPETTGEMARAAAERLRRAIQDMGFSHADGAPVTASFGVAVANVADSVDSLMGRADRALYEAKGLGRNRVVERPA